MTEIQQFAMVMILVQSWYDSYCLPIRWWCNFEELLQDFPMEFHLPISATTRQLTIDGEPSLAIAVPTNFNYTVTTIGSVQAKLILE